VKFFLIATLEQNKHFQMREKNNKRDDLTRGKEYLTSQGTRHKYTGLHLTVIWGAISYRYFERLHECVNPHSCATENTSEVSNKACRIKHRKRW
jgi:hypothetical protein